MREPDGRCELHKAEMEIRHYKHGDVARCPMGCVEQGPPGSFGSDSEKAQRPCGLKGCNLLLPPLTGGRPRNYCSPSHRDRAAYLRRRSEQVAEVTRKLRGGDRAPEV